MKLLLLLLVMVRVKHPDSGGDRLYCNTSGTITETKNKQEPINIQYLPTTDPILNIQYLQRT